MFKPGLEPLRRGILAPMKCKASVPPGGDPCPREADRIVEFKDGQREPFCLDCAVRLRQQAEAMGSSPGMKVEVMG